MNVELVKTQKEVSTIAVARKKKIKQIPVQKASEISQSNKPSGSDSITTDKKPTSSKPPPHSKRKASQVVVSDDDDKSPPRTRQTQKKRQKAVTPSGKEKGSGSSKLTSPGEKDDVGTDTSDLKAFTLSMDLDNLQGKSHVLSPVVEDAQPLATIIPSTAVEESHSTDDSPPTHKSEKANQQCSGSNNAAGHPTGSKDTLSKQDVMEETSKLATEIVKLEEKIEEDESRKATIQRSSEQELTEIARLGIQHFEAAQKLVPEIEELKKQRALIELRMSSWEVQYSKIKDTLPRDFN
ncbi:uncharacterized protein LOC131613900 [Vicia villosa]|uniref:uncharacterized protein LOC131613900 n=1 Tax=Vicia villosa TaxID=3911 RepID=UPI00273B1953|nr:uncharacterized protein LOC131613900 [Vicia villosa]